jgi:hypothetical protein
MKQEIKYEIKYAITLITKDIAMGRTNIDKIITIKKIMILFKSGFRKIINLFMLL